jgi:hypothetical protein
MRTFVQFCLILKCMSGLVLKLSTGLAESLLKLAQLDWNVPATARCHDTRGL